MSVIKVLLSGTAEGKLSTLYKRVAAVNQKNGPFDVLLCVGSFLPRTGAGDRIETASELDEYLSGSKQAPLPTYFIGACEDKETVSKLENAGKDGKNLHYLGSWGVKSIKGLLLAFLDGEQITDSSGKVRYQYHKDDIMGLKQQLQVADGDIDFLLTPEWPTNISFGHAPLPKELTDTSGSAIVADIAQLARPRYHIAAGKDVFFARAPYINPDLGAGPICTRFISLAGVGNAGKHKFLHALAVTPACDMSPPQLSAVPEGATASPYHAAAQANKRAAAESDEAPAQSWRWQMNKKHKGHGSGVVSSVIVDNRKSVRLANLPFKAEEADIIAALEGVGTVVEVRRGTNAEGRPLGHAYVQFEDASSVSAAVLLDGVALMGRSVAIQPAEQHGQEEGRQGKPVPNCWFCLSNPDADVQLVVSVGEESYVAIDKGPIHPVYHALLLPIEHCKSSVALSPTAYSEMERYLSALQSAYAAQGRQLVAFERFVTLRRMGGNHCHINVAGIPLAAAAQAQQVFEDMARDQGFDFQVVPAADRGESMQEKVRCVVADGEYFMVILPDGTRLVHPILRGERHNLNFGREVLAKLFGTPARADWKQCQGTVAEEEKRAAEFKTFFKPYDIMQ